MSQNEPWCPKTPQTAAELSSQNNFIKAQITQHHDSSPTSINMALNQLTKGAEMMIHEAALLKQRVAMLQKANEAANQRKARKRRRIQKGGSLTVGNGVDLSHPPHNRQDTDILRQNGPESVTVSRAQRRCGYCREIGHRVETCTIRKANTI
jgi:multidrug efflux pump subunit AcrA (membrane-fusion protein)